MKRLVNKTEHLKQAPMPWFIIAIELLGLVVLQVTQILTIHTLRGISKQSKQSEIAVNQNLEYSELATLLSNRLSNMLKEKGLSQAEWARQNQVSTKSVSILINHQKRMEAGKECISRNELNGIRSALG